MVLRCKVLVLVLNTRLGLGLGLEKSLDYISELNLEIRRKDAYSRLSPTRPVMCQVGRYAVVTTMIRLRIDGHSTAYRRPLKFTVT